MTDKLNQEIKIKAKQVTEDLMNFMQDLDTENNYQIKELEKDIEYYKSRIEELEQKASKLLPNENEDFFFVYGSGHSEYSNANNNEWLALLRKCLELKEQGIDVVQQFELAKEIIQEYAKWECEYCNYERNPNYVTEHCSQCQKYPLHKKAEAFINNGDNCPDVFCEDCTKADCNIRKLGLVPSKE